MPDETTTADDEPLAESTEEGEQADAPKPALPSRSRNPLTRDSDIVARPGFRSPSNQRTKASKDQKKKGKKKR